MRDFHRAADRSSTSDVTLTCVLTSASFSSANHSHMMALLQQLLYSESLSLSWRDIIVPVVQQVVQTVRPDVRNCDDDMDIRQLVHIKKVRRLSDQLNCSYGNSFI